MSREPDGSPIFDQLDVDLVVKVLAQTVFSPFFIAMIAVFYWFHGAGVTDFKVAAPLAYYVLLSGFWFLRWYSKIYRNNGSILFSPGRFDWGEQIVVITGGASGVGELLANTLAVRNVTVIVLDIKPIVTENYNITYYKCDVSKWEEVEAVAKKISEEIGDPSVLVNNAGIVKGKTITNLSPQDITQTFGVNALSHFWTLKAFLPAMIKSKAGHIVTVASNLGLIGAPNLSDYCASKAAVSLLHESLRYELDERYDCPNIRTTLVQPGHIATPLFAKINLPTWTGYQFLFPSLQPVSVVKRIIQALDAQHGQIIRMPLYVELMPFFPALPSFVRDLAQNVSGANGAAKYLAKEE